MMIIRGVFLTAKRLLDEEDGVIVPMTVVVFLSLFMIGASVFAISEQVRYRMEIQNAADTAAYSAATVQADTLSRMATINRAMAWTYTQQAKTEMEYITLAWLDLTMQDYNRDKDAARNRYMTSYGPACSARFSPSYPGSTWGIGWSPWLPEGVWNVWQGVDYFANGLPWGEMIEINREGRFVVEVELALNIGRAKYGNDFQTARDLIDDDHGRIAGMNLALDELAANLNDRIEAAAAESLKRNLSEGEDDSYSFTIRHGGSEPYFEEFTENHDRNFMLMGRREYKDSRQHEADELGIGHDVWYLFDRDGDEGMIRKYQVGLPDILVSRFWSYGIFYPPPNNPYNICVYEHTASLGAIPHEVETEVRADDDRIYDETYYNTSLARPRRIAPEFFGEQGSIVVGVNRPLRHPFSMLGASVAGYYEGFDLTDRSMWAVAAARAGFKDLGRESPAGEARYDDESGFYNPTWESKVVPMRVWNAAGDIIDTDDLVGSGPALSGQDERHHGNLMNSDWDAVMLPLTRAWAETDGGDWVQSRGAKVLTEIRDHSDWHDVHTGSGADGPDAFGNTPPPLTDGSGKLDFGVLIEDMILH